MKRIIAVLLLIALVGGGLGGLAYAQVNGHEPMTGHKLYAMGSMGTYPSGLQVDLAVSFTNPDCVSDITIERVSIIRDDGEVMFEGKLSELPASPPYVDVLEPHQVAGIMVAFYIPDGSGGWLSYEEALALPPRSYIVEIFYSVSQDGGLPLTGERHTAMRSLGEVDPSCFVTVPMVNIEQVLEAEKAEKPEKPPKEDKDKDTIVIGAVRSFTGPNAFSEGMGCFGPLYRMWVGEVNADGGIYVAEYGKKLPIELIIYDDGSDVGTMMALTEKLIVEDQVDILLSASGDAFIAAQAPIANEHGYILLTAEGNNTGIRDMLPELPYVFTTLAFSDHYQLPVFADMLAAEGIEAETAYIVYQDDAHGVEYAGVAVTEFDRVGIEVLANVSVPLTETDFVSIIQAAKAADPDVFCIFAIPPINIPVTVEAMAQGFNPDAYVVGPGGNFGYYGQIFGGPAVVEGVTCFAAANEETSLEFAQLYNDLEAMVGLYYLDWWGAPYYWSLLQIWQQAIETTGTLDQDVLRDYIATSTFDTVLGPTWFETIGDGGGLLAKECHPGEIGQWQGGTVEIVGGGDWPATVLTADFVYPKPDWPVPPQPQYNQVGVQFATFWDCDVSGDSFSNDEVTGVKRWHPHLNNWPDGTGAPLTSVNLRLDSGLAFDDTWCINGTLVTPGPPVYEWFFDDVAEGAGSCVACVRFLSDPNPFPITFTPGFDASRIPDQTEFTEPGTQTLTISVTPLEQTVAENLCIVVSVPDGCGDLVDAVIQPPVGVDFNLVPGGQLLWVYPSGLTVGEEWTTTVTIAITPEVPGVDFMPTVGISWNWALASGNVEGSSISRPAGYPGDGVGTWTWSATGEGDLVWNWMEYITPGIFFDCYCEE